VIGAELAALSRGRHRLGMIARSMDPGPRSLEERLLFTLFSAALGALAASLGERVAGAIWARSIGARPPKHLKLVLPAGARLGQRAAGYLAGRARALYRH
jgi:hypothetical protein